MYNIVPCACAGLQSQVCINSSMDDNYSRVVPKERDTGGVYFFKEWSLLLFSFSNVNDALLKQLIQLQKELGQCL